MTRAGKKRLARDVLSSFAAVLLGFVIIFPIVYCFCVAFKTRPELSVYPPKVLPDTFLNIENFRTVFSTAPLMRFMLNSVIVSGMGCFLRICFAILAAYAFAYFEFRGKGIFFVLILGTMMLPADTLVVTNYLVITKLKLLDNYLGMCITSLAGATQMFMLRQNFKTIPRSFRDAAFMDGCGDLRYLFWVVTPMSSPVILILMLQSFITFWNAYLWPLLVTNRQDMRTVQVGISMLTNPMDTNYTVVLAAVAVLLIPSFFLFALLRMAVTQGISTGALVG
jgi:sn-glycerol 3-phosphate transport system permease protein